MSKNDDRIIQLKKAVEDKKEALAGQSTRFAPTTNMSLAFISGERVNLHTLTGEGLVQVAAQLKSYELGAVALGLSPQDVIISGFPVSDWISDVMDKLKVIAVKDEQAKLAKMEATLKGLLSADKKTELALDELEAML